MRDKPALTPEERRARKAERREKQRAANVGRAAKMRLARLAHEAEHPPSTAPPAAPRDNIGCSGWYYWHWRGDFYPNDMERKAWFSHYADTFQTVELNAPFYAWPTVATVKTWLRQAEGRPFVYTVKACELITHVKKFARTKELVRDFGFIADLLGERLGCFLFQLPPSYSYSAARLKAIVAQLNPAHRNVVEFRHASWWNDTVRRAFRDAGIIFCSCSAPRLPDELVKTADDVYIRFHGKTRWYRHDYSAEELAVWAARIRDSGAARVWAYFNNDMQGHAVRNALALRRQLEHAG